MKAENGGIGKMNDTIQLQPELLCMLDATPIKTQEDWALRRMEILRILSEEEYGITSPPPASVTGCVTERNAKCCCGHAVLETIDIPFDTPKGIFRFPVRFSARQRRANTRCFFC